MNVKPMRRYRSPGYPVRLEVVAHPEILQRHTPAAWLKHTEVAGAVALLLAAQGCTSREDGPSSGSGKAAVVAPVFEHGDGRGVVGCIVIAPPVFLSEEEALQIIAEELGRSGIRVSGPQGESTGTSTPHKIGPVTPDGLSVDGRVAFEFVSRADYFELGGARSLSTVQAYNLKNTATSLTRRVADRGEGVYFGTFYDPVPKIEVRIQSSGDDAAKEWKERIALGREQSKQMLREQVTDFVNWLQGQGAI